MTRHTGRNNRRDDGFEKTGVEEPCRPSFLEDVAFSGIDIHIDRSDAGDDKTYR
jgi:hypothetical protein